MDLPTISYRSMKHFKEQEFMDALASAPFHVGNIFDDVNDSYWYCSKLFCNVIDEHAPLKSRRIKPNQIPYINGDLRRAINVKAMLKRRCDKHPSMANWELYRHQRNRVTKLRKSSINSYFSERCTSGNNFWNTI